MEEEEESKESIRKTSDLEASQLRESETREMKMRRMLIEELNQQNDESMRRFSTLSDISKSFCCSDVCIL